MMEGPIDLKPRPPRFEYAGERAVQKMTELPTILLQTLESEVFKEVDYIRELPWGYRKFYHVGMNMGALKALIRAVFHHGGVVVGCAFACALAFLGFYRCRTEFGIQWRWHWYERTVPRLSGTQKQVSRPEGEGSDESHTA